MQSGASISRITCEHYHSTFAIGNPSPRLSWRFSGDAANWTQSSYEIEIFRFRAKSVRHFRVESASSVLVPWPDLPLESRERVCLQVKANGTDQFQDTAWFKIDIEMGFVSPADEFTGRPISCPTRPLGLPKRPFLVRQSFRLSTPVDTARLSVTALGLYEMEINGVRVGDQLLAPGWTSYKHRLELQTYDVTDLLIVGENVIGGQVAEGWYCGRFGFEGGHRDIYGSRMALLAQLDIDGAPYLMTDSSWSWSEGPLITSELYDGEVFDYRSLNPTQTMAGQVKGHTWKPVDVLDIKLPTLVYSEKPPVRETEVIQPINMLHTPSGKTIFDFGVNLVGYVRVNRIPASTVSSSRITLTHAEVLEHGELGTRPLRQCAQTDVIMLDDQSHTTWQPKFTYHGFRYVQVDGIEDDKMADLVAIRLHSDMEETGWFASDHDMVNQLWKNVKSSMRGNFVSIPTDCPQRDERLGWTGDLNVFAETATFLYDVGGLLRSWLVDLAADQADEYGVVPVIVPNILQPYGPQKPIAIWGDVCVSLPYDLRQAYGDDDMVVQQWNSMESWLDDGIKYDDQGLWSPAANQLGDWLDPAAPPERAGDSVTDPHFVANAWLVHSLDMMQKLAGIVGDSTDRDQYARRYSQALKAFTKEYQSTNGRLCADTQTGVALALRFGLVEGPAKAKTIHRLDYLVRRKVYTVNTGFAGTPIILDVLADNGCLDLAYRMLLEQKSPSWLYPVLMGATTIWERWDSMLPDGSINPGEMTSFNHYALGAVANFVHRIVGGISPLEPGWKSSLIAPRPQPGSPIRSAKIAHLTPYGLLEFSWSIHNDVLSVSGTVPLNTTAQVVIPGLPDRAIGSGRFTFSAPWEVSNDSWPPMPINGMFEQPPKDSFKDWNFTAV